MSKLIIVGERLNSSNPAVLNALKNKDEKYLINEAIKQKEAGANYLDLNASMMMEHEIKALKWAIRVIQNKIDIPISIDTPNMAAIEEGLKIHKGAALVNSLTAEKEKFEKLIPLVKEYKAKAVIMCFDERGVLQTGLARFHVAVKILNRINSAGINFDNIFIDPIVQPIATNPDAGKIFLDSLYRIKNYLPKIKTIAGISNISFGMPKRQLLNGYFLALAIEAGLDAAIINPLDEDISAALMTTEALIGEDPMLKNYFNYIRKKQVRQLKFWRLN